MLYKTHNADYLEDFGLVSGNNIYLYEAGKVGISEKMALSPVVRVNCLWMDKDIKVRCHIAATLEDKIAGLTRYQSLGENEGLMFPYPGGSSVTFHQGGVKYPLDIIFLQDNTIIKLVANTDPDDSEEQWKCHSCDTVIEVNGAFCEKTGIRIGDRVMYSAVSDVDLYDVVQEMSALTAFADLI